MGFDTIRYSKISFEFLLNTLIPFLIIPVSIFIDIGNGLIQLVLGADFSIGILYRGFFLMALLPMLLVNKSKVQLPALAIIILFVFQNYLWLLSQNYYSLSFEITSISKVLYLYILITFYAYIKDSVKIFRLLKLVCFFGTIGGLTIIFSFVTGIGLKTYGEYAFGVKSFFQAQNDTSLSLLLSLCVSLFLFFKDKRFIFLFFSVIISLGCFLLGTRAGIAGSILIWVSALLGLIFFRFRDVAISKYYRFLLFFLFVFAFIYVGNFVYEFISNSGYLLRKFSLDIFSGAGPRGFLVESGNRTIENFSWIEMFFGQGKYGFYKENHYTGWLNYNGLLAVEVDYLDIIGSYGFFLGVIILLFPVFVFLKSLFNLVSFRTFFDYMLFISILIYLGHSFLAGHAIASPIVSTVASVCFFFILYRRELFKEIKHDNKR